MHKSDRAIYLDSNLSEVPAGSPYIAHMLVDKGGSVPMGIARHYGLLKDGGDVASDAEIRAHVFRPVASGEGAIERATAGPQPETVDTDSKALRSGKGA